MFVDQFNMDCNITEANCSGYTTLGKQYVWMPPEFDPSVKNIILMIVLVILDIVTIFGNLLVLLSFVIERRLLQPFNLFILNLAVTDFSVAITAMTFYTIDTVLGYWPFGSIMCGVWIYFDFAMTFASVFTLVAISIDRFWCVTWAIHYKMHNNRSKTMIILGVIWYTPTFSSLCLLYSYHSGMLVVYYLRYKTSVPVFYRGKKIRYEFGSV